MISLLWYLAQNYTELCTSLIIHIIKKKHILHNLFWQKYLRYSHLEILTIIVYWLLDLLHNRESCQGFVLAAAKTQKPTFLCFLKGHQWGREGGKNLTVHVLVMGSDRVQNLTVLLCLYWSNNREANTSIGSGACNRAVTGGQVQVMGRIPTVPLRNCYLHTTVACHTRSYTQGK